MGTRHFVGTIMNGKYVIAQYGQWDGYISGQGATVLKFLAQMDIDIFKEKLNNCRFVSKQEIRQMYVNAGDSEQNTKGWVTFEVAEAFNKMYPSMSRDTGAKILQLVYDSESEIPLCDEKDFLSDSLFCEYAYVINLDTNKLVCYVNGNNMFAEYPLTELPDISKMEADLKAFRNS